MDEELRYLTAVRLVRRQCEDDLDGADHGAVGEPSEKEAATRFHIGRDGFERGPGLLVRERRHVADGRAAGDAVGEHGCEAVEVRVRVSAAKTADFDLL